MKFIGLLFFVLFFTACNSVNDLVGKKYYALEVNINAMSIVEYQMNFISLHGVEMSQMVYCNPMECLTKENSPKMIGSSAIKAYNYEGNQLKIDGIPDLTTITILPNGNLKANTQETMYTTSVTELTDEEKKERVTDYLKGSKPLGKIFAKMLNNSAPKALIEKKSDGSYKFN